MPDTRPQPSSTGSQKPKAPAPFTPGASSFKGKEVDFTTLGPKQEPEPSIEQGVDLSGKPKIIFAAGRGKTGKTTLLRWMAEKTILRCGEAILADIDPSNASFSQYFENVVQPETDHPAGVTRWLQELIEHCIAHRQSAIVDLGGGDTTLRTLASEMPGLASHVEAAGLAPVMLYMLGTQAEDLMPAMTLTSRGFSAKAQALVLNEVAIDAGATRKAAFGRITTLPGFAELARSSVQVWMPRLFAAEAVEIRRCSFHAARDGEVSPPLGIFDAARVRAWMDTMDRRFEGIGSWIP
jgi:Zeta toxin